MDEVLSCFPIFSHRLSALYAYHNRQEVIMNTATSASNKEEWLAVANLYMQSQYCLPVYHGCLTECEFYSRFGNDGQKSPQEAVDDFADKYDLFSRSEYWCQLSINSKG